MTLFDPHRRWGPRGICRWEDRGLFFADAGMPNRKPAQKVQALWDQAKEICAMCPVLAECKRDTLGEDYGVFGGLDQFERWKLRRSMSQAVQTWPEEKRLAWGKELHEMREANISLSTIQTQTGLYPSVAMHLIEAWLEHLEKAPKVAEDGITDLPLPEPKGETPFPDKPGRRDAWVRHNGVISDAWYRGETPDGEWINVTINAGRGQTHKWIGAQDVKLYRPQAVIILNYVARPKGQGEEEAHAAA
jgi:hypothetical protein